MISHNLVLFFSAMGMGICGVVHQHLFQPSSVPSCITGLGTCRVPAEIQFIMFTSMKLEFGTELAGEGW